MLVSEHVSDDELRRRAQAHPEIYADLSPEQSAAEFAAFAAKPEAERRAALDLANQVLQQQTGRPFDLKKYFPQLRA